MEWIVKEPILPKVGTKQHRAFKEFLWEKHDYHTRNRVTSLKPEYIIEYWNEFKSLPDSKVSGSTSEA